jgi:hypothetical protein
VAPRRLVEVTNGSERNAASIFEAYNEIEKAVSSKPSLNFYENKRRYTEENNISRNRDFVFR